MESRLTFGGIVDDAVELVRSHAGFLGGLMLAILAGYSLLDVLSQGGSGGFGVSGIVVGVFVQYAVVERLLADRIPEGGTRRKRRYWAVFGAGFLGGIAILLGFAMLVVPGIFLLARWSASTPYIVAEDMGATDALAASWRATAEGALPVSLVYAAYCFAFVVMLVGITAGSVGLGMADDGLAMIIGSNFAVALLTIAGWVLGVAVYRQANPVAAHLDAVFA